MGHENKCATPHGHNYFVYITAEAKELDALGRVVDFAVIKERVGTWIDRYWDHTFLVYQEARLMVDLLAQMPGNKPPFICPFNPTAENIALYLLHEVAPTLLEDTGVSVVRVRVEETENCSAEAYIVPQGSGD
jgi:6-pyruvoyltetrahydropterin/6-carboxytetrahydropterin synthase